MRVVVTRPESDAQKWVHGLRGAGFDPLLLPLIGIGPAQETVPLQQAWLRLADYAAVMFVSGNAVKHFFSSKPPLALVFNGQIATKTRAWATGPGTVRILLRAGVEASQLDAPPLEAGQFDSESLWAVVQDQVRPGMRVLIVRGADSVTRSAPAKLVDAVANVSADPAIAGSGRDWLAVQLTGAGAQVDMVVAYQRCAPDMTTQQHSLARAAAADGSVWLFSSSEAIANLAAWLPGQSWQRARAVATHLRIAANARKLGFGVVCESRPLLASVVASLESMA